MPDEKEGSPIIFTDDEAVFYDLWAMEEAGVARQSTENLLRQCHEDIQRILAYTLVLKGSVVRNPFERSLDIPMHPLMNLI